MSQYTGWNESESRNGYQDAVDGDRQLRYGNPLKSSHIMGSFTPINNGHVTISAGNHRVQSRSRGLNSDDMYEIPDEAPQQGSPALKKRRTLLSKAPQRKSTPTSTLTHPWRRESEKEMPQLSTPPDSKKRTSARPFARTELFPDLPVIKPMWASMQLTTTEGTLKANSVPVGQTTMDKLGSFRYHPTLKQQPVTKIQYETGNRRPFVQKSSVADPLNCSPIGLCLSGSSNVYGKMSMANHDDVFVVQDEEEQLLNQEEPNLDMLLDSEDNDFPVDGDLEAEMAQFSVSENPIYETISRQLEMQSLDNGQFGGVNKPTNFESDHSPSVDSVLCLGNILSGLDEQLYWQTALQQRPEQSKTVAVYQPGARSPRQSPALMCSMIGDVEYAPSKPFARPGFPPKVNDRSPITGVSSNTILRTCFRIGEVVRESALCESVGQDAVIELFARVTSSSRSANPSKLHFQFADLFHDRHPFIHGELENDKISALQETESRMILECDGSPPMVRCLGRLKRAIAGPPGWILRILNIRGTDWEEIMWTKGIAGAGMEKSGEEFEIGNH